MPVWSTEKQVPSEDKNINPTATAGKVAFQGFNGKKLFTAFMLLMNLRAASEQGLSSKSTRPPGHE